ncbi:arginine vasopressin-induced protein 1-like [Alosa alosa]|uniref:arginine vasopressin-induced protein 1-like n=1 Tax=Alosa alosa TaxID=278164 RepID=UPI00201510E7|nr:arginine vasopressin-induced protein 1-like [Alosa alosa]XP_048124922.1 arginine vasopressin-induced protein 1-like [Alosa alosa]
MAAEVPTPVTVAGPSRVWCRRSRKVGVADIFVGVSVRELQHLFRSSGDDEAEQRAQVVWGRGDPAELTQALMGLRARGWRNRSSRHTLGPRWLRAFGHLRISENSTSGDNNKDKEGEAQTHSDGDTAPTHTHTQTHTHTHSPESKGEVRKGQEEAHSGGDTQTAPSLTSRVGLALRRGGEGNPERYLHRIIH